jgi:hypothetical protein
MLHNSFNGGWSTQKLILNDIDDSDSNSEKSETAEENLEKQLRIHNNESQDDI